jgi:T4 RnlA family RNA ligase
VDEMNEYQTNLYNNLMSLVANNEAFYFQDFQLENRTFRIFNYRLASYTDFMLPGAMECRGVMFEITTAPDGVEKPFKLTALPMEKFFNLNENPMTMNVDLSTVVEIQEKADGSLMSSYMFNGQLRLKSKGSLFSEQAIAAMKWLDTQPNFKACVEEATRSGGGYTVNLEWCSPEHRIVLGYMEPTLKVLNIRDTQTGEYRYNKWFNPEECVELVYIPDPVAFVQSIPSMQDVEGYVVRLASGQRIKIKTEWYLSLHHAKDSVNNPRRLFEAILEEGIDDLRSLFYTDLVAMKMIDEMQVKVDHLYNAMVIEVESYYEANKALDRKEYAIKGQKEVTPLYFGLVMNKYSGKAVDYKTFLKGKWKEIGLKDQSLPSAGE